MLDGSRTRVTEFTSISTAPTTIGEASETSSTSQERPCDKDYYVMQGLQYQAYRGRFAPQLQEYRE